MESMTAHTRCVLILQYRLTTLTEVCVVHAS